MSLRDNLDELDAALYDLLTSEPWATNRAAPLVASISDPVTGGLEVSASGTTVNVNKSRQVNGRSFDIFDCVPVRGRRTISLPNPYSAVGADLVHPSVVHVPSGLWGFRYWMAYTPYPLSDSQYENPCIATSQDGETWETPFGIKNPLVAKPAGGYNADTQLVLSADNTTLYLIYRERIAGSANNVKVIETKDGKTWSAPVTIMSGTYGSQDYASPSVMWDSINKRWICVSHNLDGGGTYPMQVNYTTGSSIYTGWGANQAVTITNPTGGRTWWHSGFIFLPEGKIVGLIQDTANGGGGGGGALFAAESLDYGLTFAVRQVYSDLYYYRPNLNLFQSSSGEIGCNAWIGRQYSGPVFSIRREDWRQGAAAKSIADMASALALSGSYPASVLWHDTFNKADGAIGNPLVGTALTVDAGTMTISSNKIATGSAGNNRAMVSVANTDHIVETTLISAPGSCWLIFRGVDTSNFYRVGFTGATPAGLTIQSIVAGAVGSLNRLVVSPVETATLSPAVKIRVVCRGKRFRIYVNDVFWEEIADTINSATATKIGLQGTNAGCTFDNLLCLA